MAMSSVHLRSERLYHVTVTIPTNSESRPMNGQKGNLAMCLLNKGRHDASNKPRKNREAIKP